MIKRLFKYTVYVLLALFLLAALLTQTGPFKNVIKAQLEQLLAANLSAQISIDRLSGNLLSSFIISGLLIQDSRDDTVAWVPAFSARFSPLELVQKKIVVDVVHIRHPIFHIKQYPDSSWNIEHLVPAQKVQQDTVRKSFDWEIDLSRIRVSDADIKILPLSESRTIPKRIKGLNSRVSVGIDNRKTKIDLKEFYLSTSEPDFVIKQLKGNLSIAENRLSLSGLTLRTEKSEVTGRAELDKTKTALNASLESKELFLAEFAGLFSIPLKGVIEMDAGLVYQADSLAGDVNIQSGDQTVAVDGFFRADTQGAYLNIKTEMIRLNPTDFYGEQVQKLSLNGLLALRGRLKAGRPDLMCTLQLDHSRIIQEIDSLDVSAQLDETWRFQVNVHDSAGMVSATGQIRQPLVKPQYDLDVDLEGINLAEVRGINVESDIHSRIRLSGTFPLQDRPPARFEINSRPSTTGPVLLDTLYATGQLSATGYRVDSLMFKKQHTTVFVNGLGTFGPEHDLSYWITMEKAHFSWPDSLSATGTLTGKFAIRSDSLGLTSTIDMQNVDYSGQKAERIAGEMTLGQSKDRPFGHFEGEISQLASFIPVQKIALYTKLRGDRLETDFFIAPRDSVFINAQSLVIIDTLLTIQFPAINFDIYGRRWTGRNLKMRYDRSADSFFLDRIQILGDSSKVQLSGAFQPPAFKNIRGDIELPLKGLDFLLPDLEGDLSAKFSVQGSLENPVIQSGINVRQGRYRDFKLQELDIQLDMQDSIVTWETRLDVEADRHLDADGRFALLNAGAGWSIDKNAPFNLEIQSNNLNMDMISAFTDQIYSPAGAIEIRIKVSNTLAEPHPRGTIRLLDGRAELPRLGTAYSGIDVEINLEKDGLNLSRLHLETAGGTAEMSGDAQIDGSGIYELRFRLKSKDFKPVNTRSMELVVDSDLKLSGTAASPEFSGHINVARSRLYIEEFLKASSSEPDPLLVKTRRDTQKTVQQSGLNARFIENLKGNLQLVIPRNTWLKSPDMNLEISGELDIIKSGQNFDIFGTVNVLRGSYTLYGKRFDVDEGRLLFKGGANNPDINLEVAHIFRSMDRKKNRLYLNITGSAQKPVFNFRLNETPIAEADAVSYLLFGQPITYLTGGDRTKVTGQGDQSAGSTVQGLLARQLSRQISQRLGETLNLDMIEISGESDLRHAAITVGKYITNDLFVSYQKEFTSDRANEVVPAQISLEYEISRHLFLQAIRGSEEATGFDVIWKLQRY